MFVLCGGRCEVGFGRVCKVVVGQPVIYWMILAELYILQTTLFIGVLFGNEFCMEKKLAPVLLNKQSLHVE